MSTEDTGRGKFGELVADHVFRDIDGNEGLAVVHGEVVADEVWSDHGLAGPCLDWLTVGTGFCDCIDLGEELLIDERAFLEGAWHLVILLGFQEKGLLFTVVARLDDEDAGSFLLLAGFLPFGMAPWGKKVLATTAGLGLALSTAVRVIDRVHAHTADGWADTLPARTAGFSGDFVHVIAVTDDADGAVACFMEAADFPGAHFDECPATIAVGKNGALASGASDFTAAAWKELGQKDFNSSIYSTATIANGVIFVSDRSRLYAIKAF